MKLRSWQSPNISVWNEMKMGAVVEIWLEYLIPFLQWDSPIVHWNARALSWPPFLVMSEQFCALAMFVLHFPGWHCSIWGMWTPIWKIYRRPEIDLRWRCWQRNMFCKKTLFVFHLLIRKLWTGKKQESIWPGPKVWTCIENIFSTFNKNVTLHYMYFIGPSYTHYSIQADDANRVIHGNVL